MADDFLRRSAEQVTLSDLTALSRRLQWHEMEKPFPMDRGAVKRKLLEILCLKEVSEEIQEAVNELMEALPEEEADIEIFDLFASPALRCWFLGHLGTEPDEIWTGVHHHATFKLHHCKKQDKIRRPIATSIYPSAKLLTELLLSCPELVRGKEVLELGAGFHGLPSLACAAAGAKAVRCTESEATALRQLEINVKDTDIQVEKLVWLDLPEDLAKFQVVLGSDVVHDTWMAAALLRTLRRSLAPTSGQAVLVMPAAYHRFGVEEFQQLLQEERASRECAEFRLLGHWFPFPESVLENCGSEGLSYDCYVIDLVQ